MNNVLTSLVVDVYNRLIDIFAELVGIISGVVVSAAAVVDLIATYKIVVVGSGNIVRTSSTEGSIRRL